MNKLENCSCDCHKIDILVILIPSKILNRDDRYEAILVADKIVKDNNQNKKHTKIIDDIYDYKIYYDNIVGIDNIKIKKLKNGIVIWYK